MVVKKTFRTLTAFLGLLSAGLGMLHFYRVKSPAGMPLVGLKLLSEALSPFLALTGALSAGLGLLLGTPVAAIIGLLGAGLSGRYVQRVLASQEEFSHAFSADREARIPPERRARLLQRRWAPGLPSTGEPRWERDVPFWRVPGSERKLLCDIWQPPADTPSSGLAFIYLHGSGWHFLNKDVGTRPFFRQIAAQGHVIMDVAYRLCPETDWRGMVDDAKHAIAWMKANSARYGVNPQRVVIAGGSAGGHLALLAAYTDRHPDLTPDDLTDVDLSVRAAVSWYGPTDMDVYYSYAGTRFSSIVREGGDTLAAKLTARVVGTMGFEMRTPEHWQRGVTVQEAMMRALLGGTPDEIPETYRAASPVTYVTPACPPTLLLQGEHDDITSAEAVRILARKLEQAGVPVVFVEYPQTEHAFDLILPEVSPVAQAALYEVERFLALVE